MLVKLLFLSLISSKSQFLFLFAEKKNVLIFLYYFKVKVALKDYFFPCLQPVPRPLPQRPPLRPLHFPALPPDGAVAASGHRAPGTGVPAPAAEGGGKPVPSIAQGCDRSVVSNPGPRTFSMWFRF